MATLRPANNGKMTTELLEKDGTFSYSHSVSSGFKVQSGVLHFIFIHLIVIIVVVVDPH